MKKIHVGCAQFRAAPGEKRTNIEAMRRLTAVAAGRGCDLLLFPEMALTGYLPPTEMPELAEPLTGPHIADVAALAAQNQLAVAFGFPEIEPDTGVRRNTFAVFGGDGALIAAYHKMHLWDTEARWAKPGDEVPVFEVAGVKTSGWICYDTRFPELARMAFLAGADLCLAPTAWLGPAEEWELSLRARALDNAYFVAGADLINPHKGLICLGLSMIVDPHGAVLTRAEPGAECVIDAVLDPAAMDGQRSRVPLRRDRRPSVYGPLVADEPE